VFTWGERTVTIAPAMLALLLGILLIATSRRK